MGPRLRSVEWWRGPGEERRLAVRAAGLLAVARARLWLRPYREVGAWAAAGRPAAADPQAARRAVERGARLVPGATCLVRALAARRLLGAGEVVMGVGGRPGGIEAHAWLELDGRRVVGDFEPGRYVPVARPPAG